MNPKKRLMLSLTVGFSMSLTPGLVQAQNYSNVRNLATLGTGENDVLYFQYDPFVNQVFIPDEKGYTLYSLQGMTQLKNFRSESTVEEAWYDFTESTVALGHFTDWMVMGPDQKKFQFEGSLVRPFNGQLYVAGDNLKVLPTPSSSGQIIAPLKQAVRDLDVTANGQQVLITLQERALLYQVKPGQLLKTFGPLGSDGLISVFNTDESRLLITTGYGAALYDVENGLKVSDFEPAGGIQHFVFSPDGTKMALATGDEDILLIDRETGAVLSTLTGQQSQPWVVRFSPDGTLLASGGEEGDINLWNVQTGERLITLKHDPKNSYDDVYDLAFTWDGKYLLSLGKYNLVKVWGVPNAAVFAKTAHLTLSSLVKDARAVIDGRPVGGVGGAGKEITLAANVPHRLTITAPNHKPYVTDLTLQPGEERALTADPLALQGKLNLQSTPSGAMVLVNGQVVGKTPFTLENLPAGELNFSLKYAGYTEYKSSVTINGSQPSTVQAVLKETPGLRLTSNPAGASVYLNGQQMGVTPMVLDNLKLGTHNLTFKLKGYKDQTVTAKVTDAGKTKVEVVMKK